MQTTCRLRVVLLALVLTGGLILHHLTSYLSFDNGLVFAPAYATVNYEILYPSQSVVMDCRNISIVEDVLSTASALDIPLFVIQPEVLSSLLNNKQPSNISREFTNLTRASFGVLQDDFKQGTFLRNVTSKNLRVILIVGDDVKGMRTTYHIFITNIRDERKKSFYKTYIEGSPEWVHIAVFHNRRNSFLWVGPSSDKCNLTMPIFHDFRFPAAFDRFSPQKHGKSSLFVPSNPAVFLKSVPYSHFIECDYRAAALYKNKHPYKLDPKLVDRTKLMLKSAKKLFQKMDMEFWMIGGTLLGWLRQCDVIPYTTDVDVGTWIKNYNPKIITELRQKKAKVKLLYKFGKPQDSFELAVFGHGIKMDIFFHYEEANHTWVGGIVSWTHRKLRWFYPPNITLCSAELLDDLYHIPCDPVSYVVADYGPQWRDPDSKWKWASSAPNMKDMGQWPKEDWKKVVQIYKI